MLAYLGLLVVAPVADAFAEVLTQDRQSHIESAESSPCHRGHDEVMCQLCRLVDLPAAGPGSNRLDTGLLVRRVGLPDTAHCASRLSALAPHHSRAPPIR